MISKMFPATAVGGKDTRKDRYGYRMTAGCKAPVSTESTMSCGEPLPGLNGSQVGTPGGSGDNPGPKFLSLEFKSGASYEGGLDNGKKCGTGRFAWPNGAWFEGEYTNDMRQGKGERSLTLWLFCCVKARFLSHHLETS